MVADFASLAPACYNADQIGRKEAKQRWKLRARLGNQETWRSAQALVCTVIKSQQSHGNL
jgi:hypothetical protein